MHCLLWRFTQNPVISSRHSHFTWRFQRKMQLTWTLKTFFYENQHVYVMENSTFVCTYEVYFQIKTDKFGLNLQVPLVYWCSLFPWENYSRKLWKALSHGIFQVYKWWSQDPTATLNYKLLINIISISSIKAFLLNQTIECSAF